MCPSMTEEEPPEQLVVDDLRFDPWHYWPSRALVVAGILCAVYSLVWLRVPSLVTASLGMYLAGQGGAELALWLARK